jgi:hypothetical protein
MVNAISGIRTKLARIAREMNRTLRRGPEIWETVRLAPIADMLEMKKTSAETVAALLRISIIIDISHIRGKSYEVTIRCPAMDSKAQLETSIDRGNACS